MSHQVLSILWVPEEIGSNVSEEKNLLTRIDTAGREPSFLHALYIGFQQKVRVVLEVGLPMTKDLD